MNIDTALAALRKLRDTAPKKGKTLVVFNDGSPVQLILSDRKTDSPDRFAEQVVQVRLKRNR